MHNHVRIDCGGGRLALAAISALAATLLGVAARANVVGMDTQNFNPTTNGIDFVTVQSSETLKPGVLNIGLFANYAHDSLPLLGAQGPNYSDGLWSSNVNAGIGIIENWDFGISLPSVLSQSVTDATGPGAQYGNTGLTEVQLNTKYRFYHDDVQGFATVVSTNIPLIQNDAFTGNPAHPDVNLELAYSRHFGLVTWGLNGGYRYRDPGAAIPGVPIDPIRSQWIASTAANYLIEKIDTKVVGEVYGSIPVSRTTDPDDRQQTSFEGLLGLKHDFNSQLSMQSGVGRALVSGIASPDFRFYVGLNYALGPIWGGKADLEPAHHEEATARAAPAGPLTAETLRDVQVPDEDHYVARNIHFVFNSTDVEGGDANKEALDELVAHLTAKPYRKLVVEGHTDSVGKATFNQTLSELRAQAIANELVEKHGVPASKVVAIGYGMTKPIADNGNYQGRLQNRRVEFKIVR